MFKIPVADSRMATDNEYLFLVDLLMLFVTFIGIFFIFIIQYKKAEAIWITYKIYPRRLLDKIDTPTVPIINKGLQLFVYGNIDSACLGDSLLFFTWSLSNIAPVG